MLEALNRAKIKPNSEADNSASSGRGSTHYVNQKCSWRMIAPRFPGYVARSIPPKLLRRMVPLLEIS
ncbi:hypothetical protein V6N11_081887 [Hibiscus sabdariffa]|uniref:Uncharacterized protein n=1 Tax=Hibiscus sabdariffa TaxID=183260 RepID=A0ABR2Q7E9_9ROSI